jgi:tetratricopeptide (TPR) repeat protein
VSWAGAALLALAVSGFATDEFDARMKTGLEALVNGSNTQAELSLQQAVKYSPEDADAHALLALALLQSHKRPEAMAHFKTAMRLDRRYVRGRPFSKVAKEHGFRGEIPEEWDLEQNHLLLEIVNEPQARQKETLKVSITFPKDWIVDGNMSRPNLTGTRAWIVASGGQDGFDAADPYDWFEKARKASPDRYQGFRLENRKEFEVDDARGMQIVYRRVFPGFREKFKCYDLILLKGGHYRRAIYEAPVSEFMSHSEEAVPAVKSLRFPNP